MDTETKLLATIQQARQLAGELNEAVARAQDGNETVFVSTLLEQLRYNGPWRLTIGIAPPDPPRPPGSAKRAEHSPDVPRQEWPSRCQP